MMEFSDYAAITRLRYQYAYSLDSRDWELHRQLYTDQIEMDFSSYSGGEGAERLDADAWIEGLKSLFSGLTATQHVMTNPIVDVQGDRATQKMYMQAEHFLLEDGVQREFAIGGYYDDRLRWTSTGWRFEAVKLTVLWRRGDAGIMVRARERSGA